MRPSKLLSIMGIMVWTAVALTACPHTLPHRHAVALSVQDEPLAASCSDLRMEFDDREAVVQSEEKTISMAEASPLRIQAHSNGGLQVQGWDKDSYGVVLCKAADPRVDAPALLSQIHINFQNGELTVRGPASSGRWSAHLLVQAPKGAAMELSAHNGPIGVYRVNGSLKVHTENGPINVSECSGELDLTAHNGPVTLGHNRGKLNVKTDNGPVTLSLDGTTWDGPGLEARAQNGPVTVSIPSGYQSGVIVESEGHGPFQCQASVCSEGRKTWEEDVKRIEFGNGPAIVRVSTVNGPVSVD
jgi:hypothetical protein